MRNSLAPRYRPYSTKYEIHRYSACEEQIATVQSRALYPPLAATWWSLLSTLVINAAQPRIPLRVGFAATISTSRHILTQAISPFILLSIIPIPKPSAKHICPQHLQSTSDSHCRRTSYTTYLRQSTSPLLPSLLHNTFAIRSRPSASVLPPILFV